MQARLPRGGDWRAGYQQGVEDMTPEFVSTGPLVIEMKTRQVHAYGIPVLLPRNEAIVLQILARHLGRLVPEEILSQALLGLDDITILSKQTRLNMVRNAVRRLIKRLEGYGVPDMLYSGFSSNRHGEAHRMLVRRPSRGWGEEGGGVQEDIVGYSRAEVRSLLVNALTRFEQGEMEESEALIKAAISGLPTHQESAATEVGRPNQDQRVIDALIELGGEERYVKLAEIARHLRLTAPVVAKALLRARQRTDIVEYRSKRGYYLNQRGFHSNPEFDGAPQLPRTNAAIVKPEVLRERQENEQELRRKRRREYMREWRNKKDPNRKPYGERKPKTGVRHEDKEDAPVGGTRSPGGDDETTL